MNKKALEFLNHYLNKNEDYEHVKLSELQYNEVKNRCESLVTKDEELYDEVEVTLNSYLLHELGYEWNEDTYKYYK